MTDQKTTRVAVITGAGRGIGREHALELARNGVAVVVNDLGGSADGVGADATPAQQVVEEILAIGGQAVADGHDISDWEGAKALIQTAISTFGTLDILVNNAGILRDRTLAAMSIDEWDAVIRVHLRGTFAPSHFAAAYWRAKAKETGQPVGGRLINTSSPSGLYGNFGQANYAAAKAGIAALTIVAAKELASSGVTANAVAPAAATRLTASLMTGEHPELGPDRIAKLVAWLASPAAHGVTGRVFDIVGSRIGVAEGWHLGPRIDKEGLWTLEELDTAIPALVAEAAPLPEMNGEPLPARVTA
ncbi:SDR family NAD(P)-dependent oxidoreductase [Lacisediminihabitans sp. FW035]